MSNCEHYETLVSSWIDGPLDRDEQIECLDHMARCAACRDFYLDARALDGVVATLRPPARAGEPPAEVWQRIAWETRPATAARSRRRIPTWALQAAAVVVVAVGLAVVMLGRDRVASPPDQAEVALGADATMTEARFVELTREVLGADRRYHSAMYEIMEQVVRDTSAPGEGLANDAVERYNEADPGERAEMPGRVPV